MDPQTTQTYTGAMTRTVRVRSSRAKSWGLCSIPECGAWGKLRRGWCALHWQRWQKHGDPLWEDPARHGMTDTPEYSSWEHMIQRCANLHHKAWKHYGGRGIGVDPRWRQPNGQGFLNFYEDMGPRPEPKDAYSVERKNNYLGYSPENCVWATWPEQTRNRRVYWSITVQGCVLV